MTPCTRAHLWTPQHLPFSPQVPFVRDATAPRQKRGMRCARVRMSEGAIRFLVESGFLPAGQYQDADIEQAIYALFNAARAAEVTCYDARSPGR